MQRLVLSAARYRTVRGATERTIPSRFLDELRSEHIVTSDQSDALAGYVDDDYDRAVDQYEVKPKKRTASGPSAADTYPPGLRVRHPQFGEGIIEDASGRGPNAKVVVKFKGLGTKTLILEYARLTRLG